MATHAATATAIAVRSKPRLSFWEIWNMSFGFLGIQIGFAMQSFLIGTGAVVASMLPWLLTTQFGVSNEAPPHMIPDSVRLSFYFGAAVFFLAVLWTVVRSKEYAPEEMASFVENQAREGAVVERRTAEEV